MAKSRFKSFLVIKIGGALAVMWLLYMIAGFFIPLDFSQNYRKIAGVENIVFQRNGWGDYYKRCFWGLKRTEVPEIFVEYKTDTRVSQINELLDVIDVDNYIRQAVLSPDEQYILFCEIEYNFKKTGVTDDEYCYYRVCEVKTGDIITIYHAYKEWYNLNWSE